MTADGKQTAGSFPIPNRNLGISVGNDVIDPDLSGLPEFVAPQLASQWARVRGRLQNEVGDVEYRTWLRQMTLAGLDGDEITVYLPTRFLRDWVRSHYGDRINHVWQQENPEVRRVDIRVGNVALPVAGLAESLSSSPEAAARLCAPARLSTTVAASPLPAVPQIGESAVARGEDRPDARTDLAGLPDPRYTFDRFIVGKPNEFAHACARRVSEHPSSPGFNPLFLYGGVGLGKTHLMHAIAWELSTHGSNGHGGKNTPTTVAYMSAEKFMYRFIAAIRSQSTMEFKESLRSVDVLMIDDLQFLIGKDNTQEEFFHTFNALHEIQKQIVVSSDRPPKDIPTLEDRLRSRFEGGLMADIQPPDFETRLAILNSKLGAHSRLVPDEVCSFIAHKIQKNIRELEGALIRVLAHASINGEPVTVDTATKILRDVIPAGGSQPLSIELIQETVAAYYNITPEEMKGKRRDKHIVFPRQMAMYLIREETASSLPAIGAVFGGKDHTTVLHAYEKIADLGKEDARVQGDIRELRQRLRNH